MAKYKAIRYFMIETEHISIEVNCKSVWEYLGYTNGYIVVHRKGIYVDMPKDTFERNFVELKEQMQ